MAFERHNQLSDAGQARRDAMLGELISVMEQHHRRRKLRRSVAACGAAALLVACGLYYAASANTNVPAMSQQIAQHTLAGDCEVESQIEPAIAAVHITRVETEPGIADRYRAEASNMVVCVNDVELLETLRRFDRPAGLVRMGGEVFLTASVVDQPSEDNGRPNSL